MEKFLREHPGFGPEEVSILKAAFDEAWSALTPAGFTRDAQAHEHLRGCIARIIIDLAHEGERDVARLSSAAVTRCAELAPAGQPAS